jgi:hypothetical protein
MIQTNPKFLRLFFCVLLTITFLTVSYGISMGAVLRVDGQNGTDPSGCAGGGSWPTALKTIKKAIACALSGDEIWVKEDTYNCSNQINIDKSIGIYGGFKGNETQRNQRDWQINVTTINGPGSEEFGYGCFELNANTTFDGLKITGCSMGGEGPFPQGHGGAIQNFASSSNITNCTFISNWSSQAGGAIYNSPGSSLIISNCEFINNRSVYYLGCEIGVGGAIFNATGSSTTITDCRFDRNYACNGAGAIYGRSIISNSTFNNNNVHEFSGGGAIVGNSLIISNCIFSENGSDESNTPGGGGAVYGSGVITNSIFYDNTSYGGGAIEINGTSSIMNCTFYNNTNIEEPVPGSGAGTIFNNGSNSTITNSIFWRDAPTTGKEIFNHEGIITVTYSNIFNGYPGEGNIMSDPLFVDSANANFRLTKDSPCVDSGTSKNAPDRDIQGLSRPKGFGYDMGAHEFGFVDMAASYWAQDSIYKIYYAGITKGCDEDPMRYCPEMEVTRDQMAVFLGRGIHGSSFTPPPATGIFSDVPKSYWAAAWIEQFYKDGITGGCGTNPLRYCPTNPVTRAQMAIFLLRAKHGSNYKPPAATGIFDDVPVTYWAADWIEQLSKEGITKGCGINPLRYCPEASVTRAQMAVFIVRTFGL